MSSKCCDVGGVECLPSGEEQDSGGEEPNWEPGALKFEKASWLGGFIVVGEVEEDDAGETVVVEVAVEVGAVLGADERDPYPGNPP